MSARQAIVAGVHLQEFPQPGDETAPLEDPQGAQDEDDDDDADDGADADIHRVLLVAVAAMAASQPNVLALRQQMQQVGQPGAGPGAVGKHCRDDDAGAGTNGASRLACHLHFYAQAVARCQPHPDRALDT